MYFESIINNFWLFLNYDSKKELNNFYSNLDCGREKLIIIGDNDKLLDHKQINNELIKWKKNNNVIVPNDFKKNNHLNHYKNNPENYKETISNFLNH